MHKLSSISQRPSKERTAMASDLPIYPIDSANFRNIRDNGMVYVDKTQYIDALIRSKVTYYFLVRPRRFGKSLFLDTLEEYFSGNRPLFKGLAIDSLQPGEWDTYPVIRLNLTGKDYADSRSLINHLTDQLRETEYKFELEPSSREFEGMFHHLVQRLSEKTSKGVVVLIDEYDAPLSATIDRPDLQSVLREQLHGFYSVLKAAEKYIKFCFLTGVTRYGKVSVFSGLNNLNDITFDDDYAAICGITERELRQNYHAGVETLANKFKVTNEEIYARLKFYYDGYHFSSSMVDVYNPFSINCAFAKREFQNYWSRSGVPTILSKSLMQNDIDIESLNGCLVEESELSHLSMHTNNPLPLFFQTGYLTLKHYNPEDQLYTVGFPNREVEKDILSNVLSFYNPNNSGITPVIARMKRSLREGKPEDFIKILSSFLADIPGQLHKHVDKYENYYHTIFYCLATLIGLDVEAEYSTSEGFIDMLIKTSDFIYIIELKVTGTAQEAMTQIEKRHYAAPFESDTRKIVKIALGFSKKTHNISSQIIA